MDVLYLFHRYKDDVYRLAVNYTRNPQEAEDVCQTVFLKLLEQEQLIPGKEKAWLMQVTANECRNLLKSGWWKRTVPLETAQETCWDNRDEILDVVQKLPPKYRVVIYLRYYEQYTVPEIGKLLQIPTSTVTTRLQRGREQLRKTMKEAQL